MAVFRNLGVLNDCSKFSRSAASANHRGASSDHSIIVQMDWNPVTSLQKHFSTLYLYILIKNGNINAHISIFKTRLS
jgi:hypothetical protein